MKKILYASIIALALLASTGASAAVGDKTITIKELELVRESGQVRVTFSARIGRKATRSDYTLYIVPALVKGSDKAEYPPIVIKGKRAGISHDRNQLAGSTYNNLFPSYSRGGEMIEYTAAIPFQPWMTGSELIMEGVTEGCCSTIKTRLGTVGSNLMPSDINDPGYQTIDVRERTSQSTTQLDRYGRPVGMQQTPVTAQRGQNTASTATQYADQYGRPVGAQQTPGTEQKGQNMAGTPTQYADQYGRPVGSRQTPGTDPNNQGLGGLATQYVDQYGRPIVLCDASGLAPEIRSQVLVGFPTQQYDQWGRPIMTLQTPGAAANLGGQTLSGVVTQQLDRYGRQIVMVESPEASPYGPGQNTAGVPSQYDDPYRAPSGSRRETGTPSHQAFWYSFTAPQEEYDDAARRSITDLFGNPIPLKNGVAAYREQQEELDQFIDRNRVGALNIYFAQGKSDISRHFRSNDMNLNLLTRAIGDIEKSPGLRITRIVIAGFASPEGSTRLNSDLAWRRGKALERFVLDNSATIKPYMVDIYNGQVDWRGLREWVAASDMPEKYEVLRIIDNEPIWDPVRKNGRLGTLMRLRGGSTYRYLYGNVFPDLRSATCVRIYYEEVR